ncbi:hypothetical protein EDB87DRAFT_1833270 [Lactarius vividus]|nr:hypothetical protein EDB87DRAFT_1833270 [Lactarius vividus]
MSRTPHEVGFGIGDYPPQSVQNQASHGVSNFVDGSGPIFSMYLEMASEEDKKMADGWKADADGILIFTGLFSAAVASLISVSIQDIRPNPQDTSNFYLANIYHTVSDPNRSNISSSLPTSPPTFSPPNYAVWVNSLWFMSLVISLTCALLATLLQQWARRYLKVTQPRYSPHKRARIRAFYFEGVEKFLLPWVIEALPTLLHVSLFLFFAGAVVFLCNVNHTIFKLVLSWVGVCMALYGCFTFIPIFRNDSPYYTPLTSLTWPIIVGISFITFRALRRLTHLDYFTGEAYHHYRQLEESYRKMLGQGMQKTAEETALDSPLEIDTRAFMWTFDSLDEDHELERFFAGLPGFRSSKVVNDPLPSLPWDQQKKFSTALMGLFDRTFSSDLLPEPVKKRRAIICAKAIDPIITPRALIILEKILSNYQQSGLLVAEIVRTVRSWGYNMRDDIVSVAEATFTRILARPQQRDDSWFIIASTELGVQESVLRDYATHGDSLSLAVLIHITRRQFDHYGEPSWPSVEFSFILETASKFDVRDTLPELQHEFCGLWNQIVLRAQNGGDRWMAFQILRPIRNIHIALHQDSDAAPTRYSVSTSNRNRILFDPTSYPACSVPDHHPDPIPHIHDSFTRTVLHDSAVLSPASLASPDTPSSSVPAPLHAVESLADLPPLDDLHLAHQTTIESSIPFTSPDSAATARAIRDIINLVITTPHPTSETSTSTSAPPLSSTSPPATIALQLLTPSDTPNLPSSSNPVLENTLPTGPPMSLHPPMTRSDLSPSWKKSRRSIVVPTAPSTSDMSAATEDDDGLKPGLRKDRDAPDTLSVNRTTDASTMVTLYPPPQSPSLLPVTDLDIAIARTI